MNKLIHHPNGQILTDGGHDGDGEEQCLGESPVVGPVAGRVVAVRVVVVHYEQLQTFQITLDLGNGDGLFGKGRFLEHHIDQNPFPK